MRKEEKVILADKTTFRIGGPAKHFVIATSKKEIIEAVKYAWANNLKYFILGGGSNILFADKGFSGLVIKIANQNYKIKGTKIESAAGLNLFELIRLLARHNLKGLEWATGIPGTLGGAIRGNVGAYEGQMADIVKTVEVLDTRSGKVKNYIKTECRFSYRQSIFKENKDLIILSAVLKLQLGKAKTILSEIERIAQIRNQKQPSLPNAGCFFKNISANLSAAQIIDKAGLKKQTVGQAQISQKHANFIVNLGQATAKDVLALTKQVRQKVKKLFDITLQEEVEIVDY